jgi:serine/threonine protein kinase
MAVCEAYGYKVDKLLGRGAFGSVCSATKDGRTVAIKHICKKFRSWTECLQQREVASLKKCQDRGGHANLIRVMEVIHAKADGSVFIVMEFVDGGNLYDACKGGAYYTPTKAASVARDILRGLQHMHRRGFFHRDIKPENILVDKVTQKCKIADLGCAREVRSAPPYTDYVSTRWYRAPENALRSKVYSSPVDVWATGCVLGELLSKGRPLFPATSEADLAHKIFAARGNPWQAGWQEGIRLATALRFQPKHTSRRPVRLELRGADPEGVDLCDALLRLDPAARPSAQTALDHAFLKNAPPDEVVIAPPPVAAAAPVVAAPVEAVPARKALPDPSARFSYGGLFDSPKAAAEPENNKPRRFEPSAAFSYDFGSAPLDLAAAAAAAASPAGAKPYVFGSLPAPRAASPVQLPSPAAALPSPVNFASPYPGPSPGVLASTISSSPEVLPRKDSLSPSVLASTASSDPCGGSPEVLAAVPTSVAPARPASPVVAPAFDGEESDSSDALSSPRAQAGKTARSRPVAAAAVDGEESDSSDASSSPEALPEALPRAEAGKTQRSRFRARLGLPSPAAAGALSPAAASEPSPDNTAARAARVLGSSIDDSSSSDGDEAPRWRESLASPPSSSPATPLKSPPALGDATPARVSPPSLLARARAAASPAAWQRQNDENDPQPWTDSEVRRLKVVVAAAYKRARAGGASERADWYAAVWRDVRRALGHARPIKEYQAKYKLLIAEKKRLRAFVDPVETRPAFAAPDDGTMVEEF